MSFFPSLNIGVTGSAFPIYSALVGGSDGTDLRALLTDAGGQLKVLVENFPATQPVSGTIAATQSGTWTVGISAAQTIAVTNAGTFAVQAACTQSTSPWVVSLASTTITGNVSVVGTDADNATNSTTKLPTIPARANASAPSWTEGHEVPLSTDLSGNLRVSITGSVIANNNITEWNSVALGSPSSYGTSPGAVNVIGVNAFITNTPTVNQGTSPWVVSLTSTTITGTVAVTQSTSPWVVSLASTTITGNVSVVGTDADNATNSTTKLPTLPARANAAAPSWTEGHEVPLSTDLSGALRVNVTAIVADTVSGSLTNNNAAPSSNNIGTLPAIANAAAPTWTEGDQVLESVDLKGNQRVVLNAETTKVIGTVNQGTSPWVVSLASTTITGTVAVTQSTSPWVISFTAPQHVIVDSGSISVTQGTSPWVVSLTSTTITGTVAVTQSTTPWTIQGDSASGASKAGNPVQTGGVFNTTQPTVTTGQTVESQYTARGAQIVATGVDTFNVTINAALPAGTNVIGHVITDSGSTTAVTGTVAVTQSTSPWVENLTQWASTALGTPTNFGTTPGAVIAGSVNSSLFIGTVVASSASSGVQKVGIVGNSGATLDSTIGAGTAPTNALAVSGVYNTTAPAPTNGQAVALQIDQSANLLNFPGVEFAAGAAWSSATAQNTLQYPTGTATQGQLSGATALLVQLDQTSTISAGAVTFQGTYDNINWVTIATTQVIDATLFTALTNPYTFVASSRQPFLILLQGYVGIRAKLTTAITGSGTVTLYWSAISYGPPTTLIQGSIGSGASPISANSTANPSTALDSNILQIKGSIVSTAAVGVLKVGVVGNAGATFDAAPTGTAPTNVLYQGTRAATTYPTAATDGQIVATMADKAGRTAVVLNSVRDLVGTADLNSSSSSAVSFISAGASGVFNDIVTLVITNESSTATIVSLSDNGSGGNVHKYAIAANGGIVINYPTPLPQGTSAAAWDVLNSAAVALDYHAVFVKNK